jgi:hypothetical protein
MAKKVPKNQLKRPNVANHADTSLPVDTGTATTTSATHVAFRQFIELADLSTIKIFITTAASSYEGENLKFLWGRAFKEGLIAGHQLYGKTEERLKEVQEESFQVGYNEGRRDEHEDWVLDGHGTHCGYQADIPIDDYGTLRTQSNPTTYIENSTQTTPQTNTPTTTASISIQTEHPIHPKPENTPTLFADTSPSPAMTGFEIGTEFSDGFEHRPFDTTSDPVAPDETVLALETASATPGFTQNRPKMRKSMDFNQNHLEPAKSPISDHFNWADDTYLSPALPIITTALVTRSTTANIAQKHENDENSAISSQTTPKTSSLSIIKPTNDIIRVHANPLTPNDIIFQPPTFPTSASSPQPPASTGHEKSAPLRAVFKSQPHMESLVPTSIATASKTRSETAGFTKNHQKIELSPIFTQNTQEPRVFSDLKLEDDVDSPLAPTTIIEDLKTRPTSAVFTQNDQKSSIFTQKPPESRVLKRFNWSEDAAELPTLSMDPTKQLRDLSSLRSSTFSKNPFLSLQRRRQKFNKNTPRLFNSRPHCYYHHTSPSSHLHFPNPHHHPRRPFSVSLDWDQDPRLTDLSNALQALGWIRC